MIKQNTNIESRIALILVFLEIKLKIQILTQVAQIVIGKWKEHQLE